MSHEKTIRILNHIDPDLLEECAVYRGSVPPERNGMNKKHSSPRRVAVLIAAACLLLALAVTAYATGAIQSLISKYWSSFQYQTPDDALREERPDYAQWLDEQLETQAMMLQIGDKAVQTHEPYPIPGMDGGGINLLEYYYDGEKIALACQFKRPQATVELNFDPESFPNLPFQLMEPDDYRAQDYLIRNEQELEEVRKRLQTDGSVSFLVQDVWLSDHVYANGADLGPCHGDPDENGIFTIDPIIMGMGEVELPESCQNQKEVTVTMTYRVALCAFRLEGDRVYYARVGLTDYPVSFTIPNLEPNQPDSP